MSGANPTSKFFNLKLFPLISQVPLTLQFLALCLVKSSLRKLSTATDFESAHRVRWSAINATNLVFEATFGAVASKVDHRPFT